MVVSQSNLDSLVKFIKLSIKSGFVNESTANNRISAVNTILTSVPNIDLSDVTKLDINDVFQRYVILDGGKASPSSLQGRKSHLNSALKEFSIYVLDPVHYKPSSKIRKPKTSKTTVATKETLAPVTPIPLEESVKPTTSLKPITININLQLQLPATENSDIYDALFASLKKNLLD